MLPGQGHELTTAPALLGVAAGLGYSSAPWRSHIRSLGAEPVVPANPTHPAVPYDKAAYRRRHRVENLWARLKEWRALATRYDKTAASFLGTIHLAAALDWLHNRA